MYILHYVPYPGPNPQNKIYDVIIDRSNCIAKYSSKQFKIKRLFSNSFNPKPFLNCIKKHIDLIHFFDVKMCTILPFTLSKIKGGKLILDVGDIFTPFWKIIKYSPFTFFKLPIYEVMHRFSNYIISRGKTLGNYIRTLYGIEDDKIFVVYDPINFEELKRSKKTAEKIKKIYKMDEKFIIGYAGGAIFNLKIKGNIVPRGLELIKAVEKIFQEHKKYKNDILVIFMGNGEGLKIIRRYITRKSLDRNIILTGFVPKRIFPAFVNTFDIGYLESFNTPGYDAMIGAKMQYYMAASKPVITGNNGDRKILLQHQKFLLVNPLNPSSQKDLDRYIEDIKKKVLYLYENQKLITKIGKRNRYVAKEKFSCQSVARNINTIYEKILSR